MGRFGGTYSNICFECDENYNLVNYECILKINKTSNSTKVNDNDEQSLKKEEEENTCLEQTSKGCNRCKN